MKATSTPLDGAIVVVCETCYCVEEPVGGWTPRHVSWVPPVHRTRWDICDECCDRYVKCLLAPFRVDPDGAPVMPRFRHRGYL